MTTADDPQRARRLERDDGFVARSATAEDAPAILEVLRSAFPTWPPVPSDRSALEHLEWKMNPPGAGPAHHGVVESDGRIVAVKLRWLGRSWLRGVERVSDVGADMAVLGEFQGRGLGRLMNDLEERSRRPGGTVSFERPSQQAAVRHMEIERRAFSVRSWIQPVSARLLLTTHLHHGDLAGMLRATARRIPPRRREANATLQAFERFDRRLDDLWFACRDRFDLARVRDARELNWRYADPRSGRCTIVGALEGDRLVAYAVWRRHEHELHLLDLLAHPDHPGAAIDLLRAGEALARRSRTGQVVAWVTLGHPDEPIYRRAGFVPVDDFPVEFKVPRGISDPEVEAQLYDPKLRRDVTMGDFDFA